MTDNDSYIFWVFPIDKHSFIDYHVLNKCVVSVSSIVIHYSEPVTINLNDIVVCKHGPVVRNHADDVVITLSNGEKRKIVPSSVYYPVWRRRNASEAFAFVEVINALMEERSPELDPNPYEREKKVFKKLPYGEEYLDPNVSPFYYYEDLREKTPVGKTIFHLILILLIFVGLFFLIIFVTEGF